MKLLEKEVEKTVKRYAESKGWLTRKWVSPGHMFVCDQIFIAPGGKVVFVEMKRPGGKATAGQLREHEKLRNQGCDVWVIDTIESGKEMIDYYEHTTENP
jgi:hypothetical protein